MIQFILTYSIAVDKYYLNEITDSISQLLNIESYFIDIKCVHSHFIWRLIHLKND